jgi:hypothetical protein
MNIMINVTLLRKGGSRGVRERSPGLQVENFVSSRKEPGHANG